MRTVIILFSLLGSLSYADVADKAFRVTVFGKQMGPDAEFNKKVLTLLSESLVLDVKVGGKKYKVLGKIGKVVVESRGDEGGQKICIEADPHSAPSSFQKIIGEFRALEKEVPENTRYEVEALPSC